MLVLAPENGVAQTAQADERDEKAAERREKTEDSDWRFRWKDHPSLLLWKGTHVDFLMRMQADLRESGEPLGEESPNDVARRRVGIGGEIAGRVKFEIERELSGDDPWRDVYADYRQFDVARVQAGQFKLPFSLDENTGATKLDFVNRSMAADSLAPGRDLGIMVHGRLVARTLEYELGAFQHDGRNAQSNNPHRTRGERTLAGRITFQPLRGKKSKTGALQLGVAMTGSDLPEGLSSLRGRTVLGERFYTADALVNGRRTRVGFELEWDRRPVAVKAEYIQVQDTRLGQSVQNTDLSPLVAQGWYVSGTWDVIEKRPRFGSLALAARIEALEFNDASLHDLPSASPRADVVPGSRDTAATLGANWSPNRWVRVQVNVIREVLHDPTRGTSPISFWGRVVRFQVAF
jgi:phosphate-selective porin OprO and OprP